MCQDRAAHARAAKRAKRDAEGPPVAGAVPAEAMEVVAIALPGASTVLGLRKKAGGLPLV